MRKKRFLPGALVMVGFVVAMGGAETWSGGEYGAAVLPILLGLALVWFGLLVQEAQKKSARKAATLQGARGKKHNYIVAVSGAKVK